MVEEVEKEKKVEVEERKKKEEEKKKVEAEKKKVEAEKQKERAEEEEEESEEEEGWEEKTKQMREELVWEVEVLQGGAQKGESSQMGAHAGALKLVLMALPCWNCKLWMPPLYAVQVSFFIIFY